MTFPSTLTLDGLLRDSSCSPSGQSRWAYLRSRRHNVHFNIGQPGESMNKKKFISKMLSLPRPSIEYRIGERLAKFFPEKALIEGEEGGFESMMRRHTIYGRPR